MLMPCHVLVAMLRYHNYSRNKIVNRSSMGQTGFVLLMVVLLSSIQCDIYE